MDNEELGDGLDRDLSEPAAADAADEVAPTDGADVVEPVPAVDEPLPVVDDAAPVVEPEPTEPIAVFEPEPDPEPLPEPVAVFEPETEAVEAADSYDEYGAAPYADEPTVAHEVFAAPSPAAATFAAPVVAEEVDVEADDEEEDEERKGISFGTKAIIVGAAWVLLVLFLIGQFEGDDDPGAGPVGLDQSGESAGGADLAAGEEGGEEPVDLDGDGEIEPGEPGFGSASVEGASAGDGTSGSGSGGTSGGSGGSTGGGGTGDGTSDDAAPVTLPGGAPAPTTTTTVKGGSTSTTATTTKPGSGSTSTTAPATTTTAAGPAVPTVSIVGVCEFDQTAMTVPSGSTVRISNTTDNNRGIKINNGSEIPIAAKSYVERTFSTTSTVKCLRPNSSDPTMVITVT